MVTQRTIEWSIDGEIYEGFFAAPASGAKGAVLICHAWAGRGAHEEAFAKRLAARGYAAMAGDVYGKGVLGTNKEECEALMTPLAQNRGLLQTRLRTGLDNLMSQDECQGLKAVAAGFCFGGLSVLDLAREGAPVEGVAAFHAILGAREDGSTDPIKAEVLALQGFDDPMAGADDLTAFSKEMTERKARWQLLTFGGVAHAFTNEQANMPEIGLQFDAFARDRSYAAFDDFLARLTA